MTLRHDQGIDLLQNNGLTTARMLKVDSVSISAEKTCIWRHLNPELVKLTGPEVT